MRSLLFLATLATVVAGASAAEPPPNVIVIFADDLGYGDLSCQGSTTIATPRLDQMAREGARFTNAYAAAPFCSPSRAALLTGRLPARAGLPYVLFPAENHGLPAAEITLAELLKTRGYATACVGKWHLGWGPAFHPARHGFDEFFGLPYSNDSNEWPEGEPFIQVLGLQPLPLVDGERIVDAPVDQSRLTRRYTDRAVAFIRKNKDRPFFLYLPHTMPHVPQYASPEFAGKSRGGLYGDTVEEIDWSTGVILDTLRELGIDGRTLVLFTSDNGAPGRGGAARAGENSGKKTTPPKAGAPTPRFPGRSLAGSNGPLRAGKGTTFEGGVRVPLIARFPGKIEPGRVVAEPVSLMDVFPTSAALAGATLPPDRTYDGRDIRRHFAGEVAREERMIVHYFGYQPQAIREGNWKLFVATDRRPEPRPVSLWFEHQPRLFENQHRLLAEAQLYELGGDIGESRDVAKENPEVVARLTRRLREFDETLRRDMRPMEFVPGPKPPAPQTVRTRETDLSPYRREAWRAFESNNRTGVTP